MHRNVTIEDDGASLEHAKEACVRQLRELRQSYMGTDLKARLKAEQLRFDNVLMNLEGAQRERRHMKTLSIYIYVLHICPYLIITDDPGMSD